MLRLTPIALAVLAIAAQAQDQPQPAPTQQVGSTTMALQTNQAPKLKVKIPPKTTGWHKTMLWKDVPQEWLVGNPGVWDANISANGPPGQGAMRTVCGFSHMAYDDPIVFPGQPGRSHLHTFFGNTGTNANSTYKTLGYGNSTCRGGKVNMSAYWVPAMLNTLNPPPGYYATAIAPSVTVTYYKMADFWPFVTTNIVALPKGLRFVSGSPTNTDPTKTYGYFECYGANGERTAERSGVINCPDDGKTAEVMHVIGAPICWDGKNVDSPDHRSHLADPLQNQNGYPMTIYDGRVVSGYEFYCPESHPKTIPMISQNIHYSVPKKADGTYESTLGWRLSCDIGDARGACSHMDYFEHWDDKARVAWNKGCLAAPTTNPPGQRRDGHAHLSCDGKYYDGRP